MFSNIGFRIGFYVAHVGDWVQIGVAAGPAKLGTARIGIVREVLCLSNNGLPTPVIRLEEWELRASGGYNRILNLIPVT